MTTTAHRPTLPARFRESDCRLEDLLELTARQTELRDFPHAADVERSILVYDASAVTGAASREDVQAELIRALSDGPGVVVLRGAFPRAG